MEQVNCDNVDIFLVDNGRAFDFYCKAAGI